MTAEVAVGAIEPSSSPGQSQAKVAVNGSFDSYRRPVSIGIGITNVTGQVYPRSPPDLDSPAFMDAICLSGNDCREKKKRHDQGQIAASH
jgi:hypothetical protein